VTAVPGIKAAIAPLLNGHDGSQRKTARFGSPDRAGQWKEASMSRAFVKEAGETEVFEGLPDRPVSPHPNLVTPEGLAQIEAELARWQAAHAEALAGDDRVEIAQTRREFRYWTARRASAQLIAPPTQHDQVRFGSTVTIERDGRRQSWRLVGEDEAEPARGTLPYVAPLAGALMGKSVGDRVTIGTEAVEIVAIA
jgi:transcription elongation GreA/GreB family factor